MKKSKATAAKVKDKQAKLELARRHLDRVHSAWDNPTDWDDLSLYGFYCLEAAVEAAALHVKIRPTYVHAEKAEIAQSLHEQHGLPDVSELLLDLNSARKAVAYGDVEPPELNPEDVANDIKQFVERVAELLAKQSS